MITVISPLDMVFVQLYKKVPAVLLVNKTFPEAHFRSPFVLCLTVSTPVNLTLTIMKMPSVTKIVCETRYFVLSKYSVIPHSE